MRPQGERVEPRELLELADTCSPQRGSHVPVGQTPGRPPASGGFLEPLRCHPSQVSQQPVRDSQASVLGLGPTL